MCWLGLFFFISRVLNSDQNTKKKKEDEEEAKKENVG
jgi:hypothetical protein